MGREMLKSVWSVCKRILQTLLVVLLLLVAAWMYFGYSPIPQEPMLSAAPREAKLLVDGRERTYFEYIPAQLPTLAPLLVVLHGSVMNGAQMRITTGFEFDQMADSKGFVVFYPSGYRGHWNDCRKLPNFSAKREQIDDMGFIRALVRQAKEQYHIDPHRVYLVGYSNGGHMAFRVRAEAPQLVAGVAVAAASPTIAEDSVCNPRGEKSPVLMVNGTSDMLNAYDGGERLLWGIAPRGRVMSSVEAAAWFAERNGITATPVEESLPDLDEDDSTRVVRRSWSLDKYPPVVLYTVEGGGHVIPQSAYRFPRMYGRTTGDLDFPTTVVGFFGL